ncbi:MAG: hypothetical protein KGJ79_10130 [Alphaproteobacteria bacterium]|nr:hypothetical protein [Alphaproteobacteria bacterium]MDE2493968.1 hypothetical protein [Alphaproteobacteria bacterium]
MAETYEKNQARDAFAVYRDPVAKLPTQTDNRGYREASTFLHKIRELFAAMDADQEVQTYVTALRTADRRKRDFIILQDQTGW